MESKKLLNGGEVLTFLRHLLIKMMIDTLQKIVDIIAWIPKIYHQAKIRMTLLKESSLYGNKKLGNSLLMAKMY